MWLKWSPALWSCPVMLSDYVPHHNFMFTKITSSSYRTDLTKVPLVVEVPVVLKQPCSIVSLWNCRVGPNVKMWHLNQSGTVLLFYISVPLHLFTVSFVHFLIHVCETLICQNKPHIYWVAFQPGYNLLDLRHLIQCFSDINKLLPSNGWMHKFSKLNYNCVQDPVSCQAGWYDLRSLSWLPFFYCKSAQQLKLEYLFIYWN